MPEILKANNLAWAARMLAGDPDFFRRLEQQQTPKYLWIGCSDSRVPANRDHRARSRRGVRASQRRQPRPASGRELPLGPAVRGRRAEGQAHHGGRPLWLWRRTAAVDGRRRGLVDHWLHPIREVYWDYQAELEAIADEDARLRRLCELNVTRQVRNVASDVFVLDAWARGQALAVHGWVYSLSTGLIKDLGVSVAAPSPRLPASRRTFMLSTFGLLIGPRWALGGELLDQLREGGFVLLLRHAQTVPGTGDPPGFTLDDCATQRNLSDEGREQARRIGARLRKERVPVGRVLTSAWCRCRETARLLELGPVEHLQPLDSFFEQRSQRSPPPHRHARLHRDLARPWQRRAGHPSDQHHGRERRLSCFRRVRRDDVRRPTAAIGTAAPWHRHSAASASGASCCRRHMSA